MADPAATSATVTLTTISGAVDAAESIAAATVTNGHRLIVDVPAPRGGAADGVTVVGGGSVVVGCMAGGSIVVNGVAVHSGGAGVHATVRVPVGATVRARVQVGAITSSGHLSEVDAGTRAGSITVATADTVNAETGSGGVVISAATEVEAHTGSGDVVIWRLTGPARVRTGSGGIRAHVAKGGRLHGRTGSGDITVTAEPGVQVDRAELRTGSGRVRIH